MLFKKKKENETPALESPDRSFFLFSGINGAGKTSLYAAINAREYLGERISIDSIAHSLGDWSDAAVQVRAGRMAIERVRACISEGRTFNQETTLPGAVIVKQIMAAREAGYKVTMHYVGVNSVDIAIDRVHARIARGGHGISDEVIMRRWAGMPEALGKVMPLCDKVCFYDNTDLFRQIVMIEDGKLTDADPHLPDWFYYVTGINKN